MAVEISQIISEQTINTYNWTEVDINTLSRVDSKQLVNLLSTNKIVVACSNGSPCKNTAGQIIMQLLLK